MNIARLRSKRVIVSTVAVVAALGIGGGVWATAAGADVGSGERDRAGTAAVQAVGGGTVVDVEAGDDDGEAYEVEIRKDDGTEVDVTLDENFAVVTQEPEAAETEDGETEDGETGGTEAGDRALTDAERTSAEQAAIAAVGAGSTILSLEASDGTGDDAGVAYEADVRDSAGAEWDVDLDAAFKVLTKTEDR
ncbi:MULTISPECIES: PepSY domain-containing protein [Catenuloplanes]|uniref:Membrane protein YkoI n=1 Tax=Catenuloplanes niger TaxID=587534 RepID=A0AAE3ZKM2_9ACTN|nr:PepSY domain-containing protein [Catenuloplanes niger]MDR7320375.1 putative membrane protein YkoI [Catenuloplanes niger]